MTHHFGEPRDERRGSLFEKPEPTGRTEPPEAAGEDARDAPPAADGAPGDAPPDAPAAEDRPTAGDARGIGHRSGAEDAGPPTGERGAPGGDVRGTSGRSVDGGATAVHPAAGSDAPDGGSTAVPDDVAEARAATDSREAGRSATAGDEPRAGARFADDGEPRTGESGAAAAAPASGAPAAAAADGQAAHRAAGAGADAPAGGGSGEARGGGAAAEPAGWSGGGVDPFATAPMPATRPSTGSRPSAVQAAALQPAIDRYAATQPAGDGRADERTTQFGPAVVDDAATEALPVVDRNSDRDDAAATAWRPPRQTSRLTTMLVIALLIAVGFLAGVFVGRAAAPAPTGGEQPRPAATSSARPGALG